MRVVGLIKPYQKQVLAILVIFFYITNALLHEKNIVLIDFYKLYYEGVERFGLNYV